MDLPVKASEVAALADLIFQHAEGKPLSDDLRNRLSARAAALDLTTLRPHLGSLDRDPENAATYYCAVDGMNAAGEQPLLLHLSLASAPSSALFPKPLLIGRMRPGGGREVVVSAVPFGSHDRQNVRAFAANVEPRFLPRPQGALSAIAVGNRHPEISLPAAFDAFRTLLKSTGLNLSSTVQLSATREMTLEKSLAGRNGETPAAAGHTRVSIAHLYDTGLWAAIRAGWREGYNAEADHFIVTGETGNDVARSIEMVKESILEASGYTKFTTDTSRLFELRADARHPSYWSDSEVEERYLRLFDADLRSWIEDEFSQTFPAGGGAYTFANPEILRLAVKFGRSLLVNEELYDFIKDAKASAGLGRAFDFEPSIDEAETLTTPKELIFYMHWLKARGRPAQLVPPNLGFKKRQAYPARVETSEEDGVGLADYVYHKMWPELLPSVVGEFGGRPLDELAARVSELAVVARHFNGTLSIHSGSGKQSEVLEQIGKATGRRFNYKISGELQLQLLDVLSEQPDGSPWRGLFERMVSRCNGFAERSALGEESTLAARYREMGRGSYLGDPARGRVDGNLFLVFWLGNIVGSRDVESPDGDLRFFKEKLDELPADLVKETRRRNAEYIVWLARHLLG